MKKMLKIFVSALLVVTVLFFGLYFALTAPNDAGMFSVSAFQDEIENPYFHTERTYGPITDYKSAANAGKKAIADRFEYSNGSIFEWMGCDVRYDAQNDAYYIRTYHLNPLMFGGAHDVILRSDGTVIAIWGEK